MNENFLGQCITLKERDLDNDTISDLYAGEVTSL